MNIELEKIINNNPFEELPIEYRNFGVDKDNIDVYKSFSLKKNLFDYQQKALKNAIVMLYLFFKDHNTKSYSELKRNFYEIYKQHFNGDIKELDFVEKQSDKRSKSHIEILKDYFKVIEEEGVRKSKINRICFENFVNRMTFWQATGSGKSLILIKLIHLIYKLIKLGKLPHKDFLFLAPKPEIINQIKFHLQEFVQLSGVNINLIELKSFEDEKRYGNKYLFDTINIFYTKSDLLTDKEAENQLDYRNYDNNGDWYIFLDEAHKGVSDSSKFKQYINILSRNGFVFNFSATFTDDWDIFTTVSNFNLSEFIKGGYGKNIVITNQEYREFNGKVIDDYSNIEKQKIVLKSLLTLTIIKKYFEKIKSIDETIYHNPLMITIGNSVFTENSDLEMFFKELKNIGEGNVDEDIYKECIIDLVSDFGSNFEYLYLEDNKPNNNSLTDFLTELGHITLKDILKYVYNSNSHGGIEYQTIIGNDKEITFKLKGCDDPFAMIKIGSISKWSNDKLVGYSQSKTPFSENTFDKLNDKNSKINILLGATSFYEGWDSNRPNIINFINMGLSDAQKFVLQTIGRGIRINPIGEERQRLDVVKSSFLIKSNSSYINDLKKQLSDDKYNKLKDIVFPLETLFLFSTKKDELQNIVEELNKSKTNRDDFTPIGEYFKRNDIGFELYYPIYKEKKLDFLNKKYSIKRENLDNIKEYVAEKGDNLLLLDDELSVNSLLLIKEILNDENKYFTISNLTEKKFTKYLLQDILNFFNFKDSFIDSFQLIGTDQIVSFKNISINISNKSKFDEFINSLKNSKKQGCTEEQLDEMFDKGEITRDEYKKQIKFIGDVINSFEYNNKKMNIKNIAKHYYTPLLIPQGEKIEWLKHIIDVKGEIDFIKYLEQQEELINQKYDDWMFCKLDESLDKSIFIPYMNKEKEKAKFIPDFIFWFKKGNDYKIAFIDPKGLAYTDGMLKIDGYKELFEGKIFDKGNYKISVELFMYNKDLGDRNVSNEYKKYWINDIRMIL